MKPQQNFRLIFAAVICCTTLLAAQGIVRAQQPEDRQSAAKSGLERRVPWTTSRVAGTPDPPPPYQVEPAFPRLMFQKPVLITNAPGTERLFAGELQGKIFSFPNSSDCAAPDLVVDLKQARPNLSAVYGLTFHPDFQRNRYVYVCYVLEKDKPNGSRVARFEISRADPPRIDPASEQIVITWWSGGHNGGCLKFGPEGYLYISTGDGVGPSPPDPKHSGQDVTNLLSAILRIDVDRADDGKNYCVPPDNPLLDVDGARGEIWSYGFRNPWKMSFDRKTGDLWVGDVGWQLWEMVYRVQKGGNYGWSIMEGRQPALPEQEPGPTPILPPTIDHPHSEAASITGGFVYRGRRLKELIGAYIYGDFQTGIVWGARMDGDRVSWHKELAHTPLQLVGFGEDNSGELFLLDHAGKIYRLIENPEPDRSRDFPRKLSDTGLFASTAAPTPAPGVIEYSINARHWADGTESRRWLAIPGEGRITIDETGHWQFPDGSVIAKTVHIANVREDSGGKTSRLETQILHREAQSWRPYTYVWNAAQTDADLASADGFSRVLQVHDPHAGGLRELTYRFAGRKECSLCHNAWVEARTTIFGVQSASLLGVSVPQLNCDHAYTGGPANQLQTLQHIGLLDAELPRDIDRIPKLVDPYDTSADLTRRARSYLHVNCSHCHQLHAGGAANILLTHDVALKDSQTLGVRPTQGTFGISNASVISPGDPNGSVLLYRLAKLGGGRMPRVGSSEVDPQGVKLIADWIAQMPADSGKSPSQQDLAAALNDVRNQDSAEARAAAINRVTSTTRGALALLRLTDSGDLSGSTRSQVVLMTKNHPAAEVRDLFERFVPASERTKRLGTVVDHAGILNLEADSERGRQVFFSDSASSCKNCHRVKDSGETLGPDLSQIGKKYTRHELLVHILEPSRFMEPKYVPYLLETTAGRVFAGLLQNRTDDEIVLKDARGKLHRVGVDEVELLVRQQKSLMPDLLLRDMTPQQVADLLAYMAALR